MALAPGISGSEYLLKDGYRSNVVFEAIVMTLTLILINNFSSLRKFESPLHRYLNYH